MSKTIEPHLKVALKVLITKSEVNVSAETLLTEFSKTRDKNSAKKLYHILKKLSKNNITATRAFDQLVLQFNKLEPYEGLILFLHTYDKLNAETIVGTTTTNPLPSEQFSYTNENAAGSVSSNNKLFVTTASSLVNASSSAAASQQQQQQQQIPSKSLTEMKNRVVAGASSGLSKSAQSSPMLSGVGGGGGSGSGGGGVVDGVGSIIGQSKGLSNGHCHVEIINGMISSIMARQKNLWHFHCTEMMQFQQTNAVALPVSNQERVIVTELLYCLIGMSGTYILPEPQKETVNLMLNGGGGGVGGAGENIANFQLQSMQFTVSEQINGSLRHIVGQILPLASNYSLVDQFINHPMINFSQVLQALASALRSILNDYVHTLVKLESEQLKDSLNLHKLQFLLRPTQQTMSVLAEIVTTISKYELSGVNVLTLLYDKISTLSGDEQSQAIVIYLTELAAVPYIDILSLWILKGVINDPLQEFMIDDNEIVRCDEIESNQYSGDYWEKRYTIRRNRIPRFLENVSDIILRTGKYLNVIRQCGMHLKTPSSSSLNNDEEKLNFSATNEAHLIFIKNAYTYASQTLLELLVTDKDLMGHLTSVKSYLLMHQGDFICQFMDACEEELSKNINEVLPMKLENLLGLTLRTSSAKHDQYKDDVHCDLYTSDLCKEMSQIHLAGTSRTDDYTNTITSANATPWHNNVSSATAGGGGGGGGGGNIDASTTSTASTIDLIGFECFAFRFDVQWPVSLILNHYALSEYKMLFRLMFYCKHVERELCKAWLSTKNIIKFESTVSDAYRFTFSLRQRMMYAIQNLEYYIMIEVIEPQWHLFLQKMDKVQNFDDVLIAHQDFLDHLLQNCMLKSPDLLKTVINMGKVCLQFCKLVQIESTRKLTNKYLCKVKLFDEEFSSLLLGLLMKINENPTEKFLNLVHRINFNAFYTPTVENTHVK